MEPGEHSTNSEVAVLQTQMEGLTGSLTEFKNQYRDDMKEIKESLKSIGSNCKGEDGRIQKIELDLTKLKQQGKDSGRFFDKYSPFLVALLGAVVGGIALVGFEHLWP